MRFGVEVAPVALEREVSRECHRTIRWASRGYLPWPVLRYGSDSHDPPTWVLTRTRASLATMTILRPLVRGLIDE